MIKAIPEGWKRVRLADVAEHIGIKAEPGTVPYVEIGDVSAGKWIYEVKDKPAPIGAIQAIENDICISNVRPTRQAVVKLKEDAAVSAGFTVVRDKGNTEWPFVFQVVKQKHFFDRLGVLATGSTYPTCSSDDVLSFEFSLPPLPEQHKISAILGSVDKAIEKTRAVVEQTRSLKRGMMQELLTRGIPGRHKKFKKTPVGEIPAEWAVVRLGDIAHVQTGIAKNAKNRPENMIKVPYLRVANVQDGYVDLSEIKLIEVDSESIERYQLRKGDVLFNEGGDNDKLGRGCVWEAQISPCLHQNHVFAVRCSSKLTPYYLATYAASPKGKEFFLSSAKQTTNLASINSTQLKSFTIPLPPLREQQDIMDMFKQLDNRISADAAVLDGLGRMKDTLMQNLLSGKIRVEKEE